MTISCAKIAELIEMLFRLWTPKYCFSSRGPYPHGGMNNLEVELPRLPWVQCFQHHSHGCSSNSASGGQSTVVTCTGFLLCSFSLFHFFSLVSCGRLSWLMSAFELSEDWLRLLLLGDRWWWWEGRFRGCGGGEGTCCCCWWWWWWWWEWEASEWTSQWMHHTAPRGNCTAFTAPPDKTSTHPTEWAREHCRISPPRFLAECCKTQLNQGSFVLLYFRSSTFSLICIEFAYLYFPVLFCLSVSVKWLAVKTASEMTYTVSSGALNSTPTNQCRWRQS